MATVTLDQLTKSYHRDHAPAADRVSIRIEDGEFMVLLGPSGCGKTTTLRMIAGLESISSGQLSIDGAVVNNVPAKDRDIAMVFQSYALYPHMTVRDNLAFGLRRRKVPTDEIDRRVNNVAETLKLAELLQRKPHALSGGQRQRVALGRAIVRDPKVFLFDEPLSNLDASLRVSTRAEIDSLHRRLKATMIYVTHDQVEAMTLGTRICIMNAGRVMQVGRPLDVYHRPANTFVAGFLGNPPMNLVNAKVESRGDGCSVTLGAHTLQLPKTRSPNVVPSSNITFGIRAEHIALDHDGDAGSIAAEVTRIESLGAETIVTYRIEGVDVGLIARLVGSRELGINETCRISFELDHAHLFGADGKSLTFPQINHGNE